MAIEPASTTRSWLRPVDAASLAAFRIGFGALLLVATLRYFAHGWIAEYFLLPTHFFKYWGFEWVRPFPGAWMYVHFGLMALSALGIAFGYRYRLSVVSFGLLFCYQHLIDETNYLNHYYLVACLCLLLACLPLSSVWSLDARREPNCGRARLPAWMLWALRAQFALVYVFGGLAKLNRDWLVDAQPLGIWLARHQDLPWVGGWLARPGAAQLMSWAGALFDLSIVPLLLMRRTRPYAYVLVVAFHLTTARLFSIGLFPYFMLCGSLLFLAPDWPRRLLAGLGIRLRAAGDAVSAAEARASERWLRPALGAYFALQLVVPLRHWAYPGNMLWTEQGFRFSWNVMLMEKDGAVDFRVVERGTGQTFHVSPRDYFTAYQTAMMAPQADLVLQAAQVVARDYRARGVREPAVYADAFASLNGRPMQRLIDPRVDLAQERDGLAAKTWILPLKSDSPARGAELTENLE
ncbi:MAG TPA: HTTM domain-containing protein [Polyangiaceae bacterium]|nr:HTTM domain-containing protein [Polyangiaceae bacterium]